MESASLDCGNWRLEILYCLRFRIPPKVSFSSLVEILPDIFN